MLMETAKHDVRSVTGRNFRECMLIMGKVSVNDVTRKDIDMIEYFPMDKVDSWKVEMIKEIIDVKNQIVHIDKFELEELEEILNYLCTA